MDMEAQSSLDLDARLENFNPIEMTPEFMRPVAADMVAKIKVGIAEASERPLKGFISACELRTKEFPPMRWAVPGLIAEGLTILAGRPKMGKSMLALNIAFDIARGGLVLGNITAEQGEVFMYSLEDPERRVQARLKAMSGGSDEEWPRDLYIARTAPSISATTANI